MPFEFGFPDTPREKKAFVRAELAALVTASGGTRDERRVRRAVAELEDSLDSRLRVDDFTLDSRRGEKVFVEERKAVSGLIGIDGGPVSGELFVPSAMAVRRGVRSMATPGGSR